MESLVIYGSLLISIFFIYIILISFKKQPILTGRGDDSESSDMLLELAQSMIQAGQALISDNTAFSPFTGTISLTDQGIINIDGDILEGEMMQSALPQLRDECLERLRRKARSGTIQAGGICIRNYHPEIGDFIAASVEHRDGLNFTLAFTFSFDHDGGIFFL